MNWKTKETLPVMNSLLIIIMQNLALSIFYLYNDWLRCISGSFSNFFKYPTRYFDQWHLHQRNILSNIPSHACVLDPKFHLCSYLQVSFLFVKHSDPETHILPELKWFKRFQIPRMVLWCKMIFYVLRLQLQWVRPCPFQHSRTSKKSVLPSVVESRNDCSRKWMATVGEASPDSSLYFMLYVFTTSLFPVLTKLWKLPGFLSDPKSQSWKVRISKNSLSLWKNQIFFFFSISC